MQTKKNNNNAGFSLVELIVVVALMGLLIGGTLITYYTISSHNIDKAKGYIEDSLNEVRSRAMTTQAKSWEVVITSEDVKVNRIDSVNTAEDVSSDVTTNIQGNKFPSNVSISLKQGEKEYIIGGDTGYDSINISYKLLSGEVSKVSVVKNDTPTVLFSSDEAQYCDIVLTYRDRTKKIRLYYSTGKFVADE